METIRWGIIGCGDVAEVKSGPGFQKADGSALVAVMRRDRAKAEDYARRHNVPRVHGDARRSHRDADVDAVYIATPPSSHCELALKVAAAGKPCLVEKPMAMNHARVPADGRGVPRGQRAALGRLLPPRAAAVPESARAAARGRHRAADVGSRQGDRPLATGDAAKAWRFDTEIAGAGLFLDLASHYFDLIDFLAGPDYGGGRLRAEHRRQPMRPKTSRLRRFRSATRSSGTGVWNFNAPESADSIVFTGSGERSRRRFSPTRM